jgi:hypothetical protein
MTKEKREKKIKIWPLGVAEPPPGHPQWPKRKKNIGGFWPLPSQFFF